MLKSLSINSIGHISAILLGGDQSMAKIINKIRVFVRRVDNKINTYVDIDRLMRKAVGVEKFIDAVIKYPKASLLIVSVITVIMLFGVLRIETDNSMEVMLPQQDEAYITYKNFQKTFSNMSAGIFLGVSRKGGVWNPEAFTKLDDLITDIEEYKRFNEEKENARLNRLNSDSLAGKKYSELMDEFKDDPGMQRMIRRKLIRINKQKNIIDYIIPEFFLSDAGKEKDINDLIISKRLLSKLRTEVAKAIDIKKKMRVNYIYSALTIQEIKIENDTLTLKKLVEKDENGKRILPKTKKEFDTLKENLMITPFFDNSVYAMNKKTGEITDLGIFILTEVSDDQQDFAGEVIDIADASNDLDLNPAGISLMNVYMNDYITDDVIKFLPPVVFLLLFVYYLNFRTPRAVLLSTTVLMVTVIWVIGLMGYLGFKLTVLGTAMAPLLMAVGSSYSIQLLNQYYLDFEENKKLDKPKGMKKTVSFVISSIIIGSLTTMFGFLSIMTNRIAAMREWAIFTAIGIGLCVFLTFTIIPAFFMLLPAKMPKQLKNKDNSLKITFIDKLMPHLAKISIDHHRLFLAVVAILIILSIAGLFRIKVDAAPLSYFKEGNEMVRKLKEMSMKFVGVTGYNIIIDSGKTNGAIDPDFLKKVESFRDWLMSPENPELRTKMTTSFSDFIKRMHQAMNGNDRKFYVVPDKKEDITDYIELWGGADDNSDGRPDDFEPYIDGDYRSLQIVTTVYGDEDIAMTTGTASMMKIKDKIQAYIDKEFKDYNVKVSGEYVVFINMVNYVTSGQITSFLQSLIVIFLAITLLFKSYKSGFVATTPLITTVCLNFGIMGWFDIPLDMSTAMIASIAIGTGDDVNIHFIHTYRHYKENGLSVDESIRKTLATSGRAIMYSGMTLFLGFSVVGLSTFKPVMLFGVLCGFSLIVTTIGALLILPSVIKLTNVNLNNIESDSIFWKYFYLGRFFEVED